MRRSLTLVFAVVAVLAIAGCGKKAEQAQQNATGADSLLASNPTEQQSGNLTPQTDYQQPAQPAPPASTPAPAPSKPKSKPKTTGGGGSSSSPTPSTPAEAPGTTVPAGTAFKVAFTTHVTSETAQAGDPWSGTLSEAIPLGSDGTIPQGSIARGVVVAARPAKAGDRAMLLLQMTSIEIGGKSYEVSGQSDSLVAGSTRARNVGAVAGGAAAGALLGRVIGGSGKGALIGGLVGGAAATGAVAKSKGYQVEMKEGALMTFTLSRNARVRF